MEVTYLLRLCDWRRFPQSHTGRTPGSGERARASASQESSSALADDLFVQLPTHPKLLLGRLRSIEFGDFLLEIIRALYELPVGLAVLQK